MTVTEQEILDQIRRVADRELGRPDLSPEARLLDDLHLDSMELTVLAVELEDHFRLKISEEDVAEVRTVADLARTLAALLAARDAPPAGEQP
jgi:acyl carrier protein